MKKEELIQKLQDLPGNPDIAVLDWRKNLHDDIGEGSSSGIYFDIGMELFENEDVSVALISFNNDDYTDDGKMTNAQLFMTPEQYSFWEQPV